MNLAELLKPWNSSSVPECRITGLSNDSRSVRKGDLFIAYPGAASDGRKFINQAIHNGAQAVLFDPQNWQQPEVEKGVPAIPFPRLSEHLAALANRFYGEPSRQLSITGVTGTNGKTTIAYQLAQAHALLSAPARYIGTLGFGTAGSIQALNNTTPDALCLQKLLHSAVEEGIKQLCMEVSSHALDQGRVNCIEFDQAIFTNLTLDHLDYHYTMSDYAAAKARLFAYPGLKHAIVNRDDAYADQMLAQVPHPCATINYGIKKQAEVRAENWNISLQGTQLTVTSPWGQHQLTVNALGYFNIYNALAVFSSLMAHGHSASEVVAVMSRLQPAPGRMEIVSKKPYTIVDYAHTPDALENVLTTLAEVKEGKILVVFGCGGDRDKSKRPLMGKIASEHADIAIMTSDNPRTEDPMQILADIENGITNKKTLYKIENREEAIAKAISLACAEDIILVAGKGHEDYQQIGTVKHHFSDQEVIRRLIA